jgi:hypothetical protein
MKVTRQLWTAIAIAMVVILLRLALRLLLGGPDRRAESGRSHGDQGRSG